MKLTYLKPRRFPLWGKFNISLLGKQRHTYSNGAVSCIFDKSSPLPHYNHVEMSGFDASAIISYKVDESRALRLYRFCVFPQLRMNPNNTGGTLTKVFDGLKIDDGGEVAEEAIFNGMLQLKSKIGELKISRQFVTAVEKKALIEKIMLTNSGEIDRVVKISLKKPVKTIAKCFVASGEAYQMYTDFFVGDKKSDEKTLKLTLKKGEKVQMTVIYGADRLNLKQVGAEITAREKFLSETAQRMKIVTPDPNINAMAEFCKIRSSESIFRTKNGFMHAPGGGGYYAALWTNDQCEYANPFFAYYGYDKAMSQSENCYRLFAKLADENKAIITSITACGDGFWNGAGDRGDTSMFLYGLTRYLLTVGKVDTAKEFLPAIERASKFVISKINSNDVVESDSDELENRFQSGTANLSTSSISYDAFLSLSYLYAELGDKSKSEKYKNLAEKLKQGIEKWFGATVEGYETYRYCEEEKALRSWICLPLTVGITNRKKGTTDALLSNKLRTGNGILTRSGERTYWDRSTLYTIKGLFCADEADDGLELLSKYSAERLLGEHVPYPVEAFPEGNAAHLSAESALYLRIMSEGILGFRPVGFGKFTLTPSLPTKWDVFEIQKMVVSGVTLDIKLIKKDGIISILINGKNVDSSVIDVKKYK